MNSLRSVVFGLGTVLGFLSVGLQGDILIDKLMWENPDEYAIDRGFSKQWWNVELFCRSHSGSQTYIGHTEVGEVYLENTIITAIDPCFNRLLYMGQERNAIRSYGSCGTGTGQFTVPLAVDITAPISAVHTYSTYYNIYIADRNNNRAQRLRYTWTNPDAGITHVRNYTGTDIVHPVDIDLDNSGTFYPDNDDYLWIACENNKIVAVNTTTGAIAATYGGTGSGTGWFDNISAIACGRSFERDFVNTDTLYVADVGNSRIVLLTWIAGSMQWVTTWTSPYASVITDLDVDNFGQVWATTSDGYIYKFTRKLKELGVFAPEAPGHRLNNPTCISNTGGYLGGGDMLVAENWTDSSGLRAYAISTDITDLYANPFSHGGGRCSCLVQFTLADYCTITFRLYDQSGNLLRSGGPGLAESGLNTLLWDGKDGSGNFVPAGDYRSEVTATSLYANRNTSQPVNTVTKSVWFDLCESACTWKVGDADGNGTINISDAVFLIAYIFAGGSEPQPNSVGSGDADCTKSVNIGDAVYLIAYMFSHGHPPGNPDGVSPDDCTCSDYE